MLLWVLFLPHVPPVGTPRKHDVVYLRVDLNLFPVLGSSSLLLHGQEPELQLLQGGCAPGLQQAHQPPIPVRRTCAATAVPWRAAMLEGQCCYYCYYVCVEKAGLA